MKYLIAIMLPPLIAKHITTLQKQFKTARWHIRVAPHITLIHRGNVLVHEQELINNLDVIAQLFDPFTVHLDGVDIFPNSTATLFILVQPCEPLINLHDILIHTLGPFFIPDTKYSAYTNYRPHVTLFNRLTEEEAKLRVKAFHSLPLTFSFDCTSFTLLKLLPGADLWQEVQLFRSGYHR